MSNLNTVSQKPTETQANQNKGVYNEVNHFILDVGIQYFSGFLNLYFKNIFFLIILIR